MHDEPTSLSLLQRAQSDDPEAWRQVTALFGPLVYHWCRCAGLQSHDASDAMQNVFISVSRNIGSFRKVNGAGTFRGWLWMITRNEINLHFRKAKRVPKAIGGSDAALWIAGLPDSEPEEFDEPQTPGKLGGLLLRCLELVEQEFQPSSWKAFHMTAIEGRTGEEAAIELDMKPNAVRKAKSRFMQRLRTMFEGLIVDDSIEQIQSAC